MGAARAKCYQGTNRRRSCFRQGDWWSIRQSGPPPPVDLHSPGVSLSWIPEASSRVTPVPRSLPLPYDLMLVLQLTKRGYKAGGAGGNPMHGRSTGAFKAKLGYDDFSDSASAGSFSVAGSGSIDSKRCGSLASHVLGIGLDEQPSVTIGYISRPGPTAGAEGYYHDAVSEVSGIVPGIAVDGYENESVGGPQSSPRNLEREAGPSSASTVGSTSAHEQPGATGQSFQVRGSSIPLHAAGPRHERVVRLASPGACFENASLDLTSCVLSCVFCRVVFCFFLRFLVEGCCGRAGVI